MAQNRRKTKEAGLDRITLMIPAELKARIDAEVKEGVRTFSDVARELLRRGLDTEAIGTSQPRARTIGWLVAHLANDLVTYSDGRDTAAMLKVGVTKLLDGLGGNVTLKPEAAVEAAQYAELLLLKMKNAHQPTYSDGKLVAPSAEQRQLLETRTAWLTAGQPTPRKESK